MASIEGIGNNGVPPPVPMSASVMPLGSTTVRLSDGPGAVASPFTAKQGPMGPL